VKEVSGRVGQPDLADADAVVFLRRILGTIQVCAFCILSKGHPSQDRELFLWKAVEKGGDVVRASNSTLSGAWRVAGIP
jgi:hypothetical protein